MAFITVPVYPNAIDTVEQLLDDGFDVGTLGKLSGSLNNGKFDLLMFGLVVRS